MQWIALRLLALVGLGASTASLLEHQRDVPLFCGFATDCEQVTHSTYGQLAGVPLPALGMIAFGLMFLLSLRARPVILVTVGAVLAAIVGIGLFYVQSKVLKSYCSLCLVSDGVGFLLAVAALARPLTAQPTSRPALWALLAAATIAGPIGWHASHPAPPIPEQVKAHWVPNKINVVLVTDFDCPSCKQTHGALDVVLKELGDRVHFTQMVHPLPRHEYARTAARAYWFAKEKGQGEAMSKALFRADDLSEKSVRGIVEKLGLDPLAYDQYILDTMLDARIDAATAWAPESGHKGLPLLWVNDRVLVGAQDLPAVRRVFEAAGAK